MVKEFIVGKSYRRLPRSWGKSGRKWDFWLETPIQTCEVVLTGITIHGEEQFSTCKFSDTPDFHSWCLQDFEEVTTDSVSTPYICGSDWVITPKDIEKYVEDYLKKEVKMETKDITQANKKEAMKQFNEQRKTAQIEFALKEIRRLTDEKESLEAVIKANQEKLNKVLDELKPYQ